MENNLGTMPQTAPVQKRIERRGQQTVPYTRRYPEVRAGTCEYCGVIDPNQPALMQYKLCPHFRGLDLACSYCDDSKDPADIIGRSVLNIHEHPDNPNQLVVVCNSYSCSDKHLARFQLNR